MPESHADIARCSMARNDHDHSQAQGRLALRIGAELAAKRTASLKTGRNLRSLRSEPLTTSDGRLMTDLRGSQPTSSTQIGFCHMALKFNWGHLNTTHEHDRRKSKFWKIHPKDSFWFLWPKCSFPHMWKKIPHIFLTLKFIAKNDLLYFLTFSDVRKGFPHISPAHLQFPHILHVWNWLQQISSHFSTQSSELENQTKNSSHFSNVWNFGKRSFPYINSTHAENSSLFPHFLLTFSSHWNFIGMQILTFSTVRK